MTTRSNTNTRNGLYVPNNVILSKDLVVNENAVARFDGTDGLTIKNSLASINDLGELFCEGLKINNYTFPDADGFADQALITDGAGNLTFQDIPTISGTDERLVRVDGTSALQDSVISVSDDGSMSNVNILSVNDVDISNSLAVGTYILNGVDGNDGDVLTTNGSGSVVFNKVCNSSTDNRLVRTDGTNGKLQDSGIQITDFNQIWGANQVQSGTFTANAYYISPNGSNLAPAYQVGLANIGMYRELSDNTLRFVHTNGYIFGMDATSLKVSNITEKNNDSGVSIDGVLLKDGVLGDTSYGVGILHSDASGVITSSDIVDADISGSANISDTKLDTISTAGKVLNSATTATDVNTANAIVSRDAGGNFSANTITANLTGRSDTTDALKLIDNSSSIASHKVLLTPLSSGDSAGFFDTDLTYNPSLNQLSTGSVIANANGINTDTINENTLNNGVNIDGLLLKDNSITCDDVKANISVATDSIVELTLNNGVSIDGVLSKDLIVSNVEQVQVNETPFSPGFSASDLALRGGTGNYGVGLFPSTPPNPNFSGIITMNSDLTQAGGLPNLACVQWNNGIAPQQRRMFFTADFTQFVARSGTTPMLNFLNNSNDTFLDSPADTGISCVPILSGVDIGIRQKGVEKIVCYDNGNVSLEPTGASNVQFGAGGVLYSALGLNAPINSGSFNMTTTKNIPAGTAVLTSIIGAGSGTNTIPANSLSVASSFQVKANGIFLNANNQTWEFDVQINGVSVFGGVKTFTANISANDIWDIELDFTIRSIGGTGTAMFCGILEVLDAGNVIGVPLTTLTPITVNTTIANTVDIKCRPITGGVALDSQIVRVNKMY